jgi:hypothetical protein
MQFELPHHPPPSVLAEHPRRVLLSPPPAEAPQHDGVCPRTPRLGCLRCPCLRECLRHLSHCHRRRGHHSALDSAQPHHVQRRLRRAAGDAMGSPPTPTQGRLTARRGATCRTVQGASTRNVPRLGLSSARLLLPRALGVKSSRRSASSARKVRVPDGERRNHTTPNPLTQ